MYIIGLILLSLIGILIVLLPYYRSQKNETDEAPDVTVYKAQLKELDGDIERGIISKEAAKTSRLEIERRLLKAADHIQSEIILEAPNNILALALVVIILFSAGLYTYLGAVGMPDFPKAKAEAEQAEDEQVTRNKALIKQVKEKLIEIPDDARGWQYLANLEMSLGNFQKASEALFNAHQMHPDNFEYQLMYGESLIMASNERVTPAAMIILNKAKLLNPDHAGPKYYLALADYQAGDIEIAHATWSKIRTGLEESNPLNPLIDYWINKAEVDLGISQGLPQTRAPSITAEQAEEIQNMDEFQQQELIRAMVEQLAGKMEETPTNIEGWLRLSRAYMVLGEKDKAIDAMQSAVTNAPEGQKAILQKEVEKLTNLE